MNKCQHEKQFKAMKESASINRDTTHLLIPRTLRVKDLVSVFFQFIYLFFLLITLFFWLLFVYLLTLGMNFFTVLAAICRRICSTGDWEARRVQKGTRSTREIQQEVDGNWIRTWKDVGRHDSRKTSSRRKG